MLEPQKSIISFKMLINALFLDLFLVIEASKLRIKFGEEKRAIPRNFHSRTTASKRQSSVFRPKVCLKELYRRNSSHSVHFGLDIKNGKELFEALLDKYFLRTRLGCEQFIERFVRASAEERGEIIGVVKILARQIAINESIKSLELRKNIEEMVQAIFTIHRSATT